MKAEVTIVQEVLTHYRVPFYLQLKQFLQAHDIELRLIHGYGSKKHQLKKDLAKIEWAHTLDNQYYNLLGVAQMVWQPALPLLKDSDLVIVEQANKHLLNYLLLARRKSISQQPRIAFWGHGRNFQSSGKSLSERLKRAMLHAPDWWFAYTDEVRQDLIQQGYPAEQITSVNNSIDTVWQQRSFQEVTDAEVEAFRQANFPHLDPTYTGIYCGGLYPEKRLDFMIQACEKIKQQVPQFSMLIIGAGEDAALAEAAAQKHDWLYYLGPQFGRKKLLHFKIASLMLIPGLVGLAVLDAFSFQTPLVTTDYPFHSPEISYVEPGENGVITANNLKDYVADVVRLLQNPSEIERLRQGCGQAVDDFSIEKMARLYGEGIVKAVK